MLHMVADESDAFERPPLIGYEDSDVTMQTVILPRQGKCEQ